MSIKLLKDTNYHIEIHLHKTHPFKKACEIISNIDKFITYQEYNDKAISEIKPDYTRTILFNAVTSPLFWYFWAFGLWPNISY